MPVPLVVVLVLVMGGLSIVLGLVSWSHPEILWLAQPFRLPDHVVRERRLLLWPTRARSVALVVFGLAIIVLGGASLVGVL